MQKEPSHVTHEEPAAVPDNVAYVEPDGQPGHVAYKVERDASYV